MDSFRILSANNLFLCLKNIQETPRGVGTFLIKQTCIPFYSLLLGIIDTGHYLHANQYWNKKRCVLEGVTAVASANGACVRFWYYMYGDAIGTLEVYTEISTGSDLGLPRWSRTGHTKVRQWYEGSISIDPGSEFKVSHLQSSSSLHIGFSTVFIILQSISP